jgi:hypothetical protein
MKVWILKYVETDGYTYSFDVPVGVVTKKEYADLWLEVFPHVSCVMEVDTNCANVDYFFGEDQKQPVREFNKLLSEDLG